MGIMLCQLPKLAAQLIKEPTRVKLFSKPDGDNQPRPKSSALSLRQFPPSSGCAGAGEAATVRRGAGRSAQSAPPRPVTAKGGPGVLATVSQPRAATGRPSSRDTSGQEVLAMAAPRDPSFSAGVSFSVADSLPETEKNAGESENTYILRPIFQQRFRPSVVKDCIHAVLKEELANAEYSPEETPQLTKHLSESIKDKLKEMGFDRYKMVVQVVIGEQRGEGVFMAARCFWDADTDNYTHDVFMNDSLFCVVAAFGCFYY
ncbi:dynein light chain Tctex-type protein 2B isoform X2 [Equus przewalskii]|uniref:Dynein light chain Tctex-type protein 2B isoform X2 n=1 Tax=Equus przewalskii TaxID=9798 RepID=A0ABM2FQV3_EQUPR